LLQKTVEPKKRQRKKHEIFLTLFFWPKCSGRKRYFYALKISFQNPLDTLQRQNTEISKQIFPEKEYRRLSPNFHIHVSVSVLYIPTIGLPILLEEKCRPILGLYKPLTDT
jgi:hypothetical protein